MSPMLCYSLCLGVGENSRVSGGVVVPTVYLRPSHGTSFPANPPPPHQSSHYRDSFVTVTVNTNNTNHITSFPPVH